MPPKTRFGKTSTSAGGHASSSSSKRTRKETTPIQSLPWPFRDEIHRKSYEKLAARELLCTRFLDDRALEHLDLSGEVSSLFEGLGWSRFMQLKFPTYRELTLEFLSSFDCDIHTFTHNHEGNITFRLLGEERRHSLATFNAIFGFPLDGIRSIDTSDFIAENAWVRLTGIDLIGSYNPRFSKASNLKSPALRYIHKFLAHSIFGRGESTGVVRKDELFFLWAMTQRKQLNTAVWLCSHFLHVKSGSGKICVGGLVSIIADFYGFTPTQHVNTRVWGNERIDLDTLVLMGMCKKERGQYFLLSETGEIIPKRPADVPSSSGAHRHSPPFVRESDTRPRATVTATASASQTATATASASTQHTTQDTCPVTLEIVISRLEQRMERMETRLLSRFDQLDSRVDALEKKLDETELCD